VVYACLLPTAYYRPLRLTHQLPVFLHSPPPPRDLHSFPTRRSSDLGRRREQGAIVGDDLNVDGGAPLEHVRLGVLVLDKIGDAGDRKSTRLNSSHLGISYAVFCLKKKKKNNEKSHISVRS